MATLLIFIWQDNNIVLSIITAYSLHKLSDKVVVHYRRLKPTSINVLDRLACL